MVYGSIRKLVGSLADVVQYKLPVGDESIDLNSRLGKPIRLEFRGEIRCIECGRDTRKSFSQGFCFPCSQRLACCDLCIVKPELCHFDKGTCREPAWGEANCLIPHTVYLSNTSGVKVGITRKVPSRWVDQGAIQALPVLHVADRLSSGLVETTLSRWVGDKTNWRKMLKGEVEPRDLESVRDDLLERLEEVASVARLGQRIDGAKVVSLKYPVLEYPGKIVSHNLQKTPVVEGTLLGIKGQYLILDTGVLNVRKYTGHFLQID